MMSLRVIASLAMLCYFNTRVGMFDPADGL